MSKTLFYNGGMITEEFMDEFSMLRNAMLVIAYDENAEQVCRRLRDEKLVYGVSYCYGMQDVQIIENGDLFYDIRTLHPAVTVLHPTWDCPQEVQKQVYGIILETRKSQQYATLTLELQGDVCRVDEIISGDAGFVYFDKEGNLYCPGGDMKKQALFHGSLQEIVGKYKLNF